MVQQGGVIGNKKTDRNKNKIKKNTDRFQGFGRPEKWRECHHLSCRKFVFVLIEYVSPFSPEKEAVIRDIQAKGRLEESFYSSPP